MIGQIVLVTASIIAGLGVYGLLSRRNFAFFLLALELLFNSAVLSMIGLVFIGYLSVDAVIAAMFLLAVGAAELAVGFAIAVVLKKKYQAADTLKITSLRG